MKTFLNLLFGVGIGCLVLVARSPELPLWGVILLLLPLSMWATRISELAVTALRVPVRKNGPKP